MRTVRRISFIAGALLVGLVFQVELHAQDEATQKARALLADVERQYASLATYADSGVVMGEMPPEGRFETHFVRGRGFYWNYRGGREHFEIWHSDGKTASAWGTEIESEESLRRAVAGFTGVSHTSARQIPKLLLPNEIGGWKITRFTNPQITREEPIAGVPCLVLEGVRRFDTDESRVTIWIGSKDHLIRRIRDSGRYTTTLDFNPVANAEVAPEVFAVPEPTGHMSAIVIAGLVAFCALLGGGWLIFGGRSSRPAIPKARQSARTN